MRIFLDNLSSRPRFDQGLNNFEAVPVIYIESRDPRANDRADSAPHEQRSTLNPPGMAKDFQIEGLINLWELVSPHLGPARIPFTQKRFQESFFVYPVNTCICLAHNTDGIDVRRLQDSDCFLDRIRAPKWTCRLQPNPDVGNIDSTTRKILIEIRKDIFLHGNVGACLASSQVWAFGSVSSRNFLIAIRIRTHYHAIDRKFFSKSD